MALASLALADEILSVPGHSGGRTHPDEFELSNVRVAETYRSDLPSFRAVSVNVSEDGRRSMAIATGSWRVRTMIVSVMCVAAIATIAARPAEAFPRQVKGGQTALEVNINTFLALINVP